MVSNTPRLGLNTYSNGDQDWDHTDVVTEFDEKAIGRGTEANRPDEGNYEGELYFITDQNRLDRYNGTVWENGVLTDDNSSSIAPFETVTIELQTDDSILINAEIPQLIRIYSQGTNELVFDEIPEGTWFTIVNVGPGMVTFESENFYNTKPSDLTTDGAHVQIMNTDETQSHWIVL